MSTNKLTFEYVQQYFKDRGCELLETEYKNNRTKMKYRCKCGNESEIIYNSFQKGRRCMKCSGTPKHSYEFVRDYFTEQGCRLLSTEYESSGKKLDYICECENQSSITFGNFQGGHRCMKCSGKEKYTIEQVKNSFEMIGYKLLTKEYIGCDSILEYICDKGHTKTTTYTKFLTGYRCRTCCGSEKLTYEYVKTYFQDQGYELLEREYVNHSTKMKYKCDKGHESSMPFNSFNAGRRCPKCINKTEQMVNEFLEERYTNIITQAKFDWCKNINHLPFDSLLDDYKLIIEIDGKFHFQQVSNWNSPEETQKRDLYKMKLALEHGYSMIRISQEDVYNNTIVWKELLKQNIKVYETPQVMYISKDPMLYDSYKLKIG